MHMIGTIINEIKSTIEIRGSLLYWVLGVMYIEMAVLLMLSPIDDCLKYSIVFSFIMTITGIMGIIFSLINRQTLIAWNWHFTSGIIDLFCGGFLICYPAKTIVTLPYIIALWIIIRSCYSLGFSMDLRQLNADSWKWSRIFDILAIVSSSAIICLPMVGILTATYLIDFAFICMGIVRIMYSMDLQRI